MLHLPDQPTTSDRAAFEVRRDTPLRQARTCYDHLAGVAGVRLLDEMLRRLWLKHCESLEDFRLTALGARELVERGVDIHAARASRRPFARGCVDWTEQRYHLRGALASEILNALLTDGIVQRFTRSRAVTFVKPLDRWLDPV